MSTRRPRTRTSATPSRRRAETYTKGKIIKKILAIELSDEAEVQIKTLALLQKFLDSHANPRGGYEVKENMAEFSVM